MQYDFKNYFNAYGDGINDDSDILIYALNYMSTGDTLYIPEGYYAISKTIYMMKQVNIVGSGEKTTYFKSTNPNGDVFVLQQCGIKLCSLGFTSDSYRLSGYYINFQLNSNQSYLEEFEMINAYDGIRIATGACLYIDKGYIGNFKHVGIDIVGGNEQFIDHITMDNPENNQPFAGIRIQYTECINITNCGIMHSGIDLYIQSGASIYVMNTFFDTAHEGIWIDCSLGNVLRSHFIGCWMSSHTGGGVTINSSSNFVADDLIFSNCNICYNGGTTRNGFQIQDGNNIKLLGSTLTANGVAGIYVGNANNCIISDNRIGGTPNIINGNQYGIWITNPKNTIFNANNLLGNIIQSFVGEIPMGNIWSNNLT